MNTLQILIEARERISDPAHWTTVYSARDVDGNKVPPNSPAAVCWCGGLGAFTVGFDSLPHGPYCALHDSAMYLYNCGAVSVNDVHGHAAILRVYDHAIAKLQP